MILFNYLDSLDLLDSLDRGEDSEPGSVENEPVAAGAEDNTLDKILALDYIKKIKQSVASIKFFVKKLEATLKKSNQYMTSNDISVIDINAVISAASISKAQVDGFERDLSQELEAPNLLVSTGNSDVQGLKRKSSVANLDDFEHTAISKDLRAPLNISVSMPNFDARRLRRTRFAANLDGEEETPLDSSQDQANNKNAWSALPFASDSIEALETSQQLSSSSINGSDEGAKDVIINGLEDTNAGGSGFDWDDFKRGRKDLEAPNLLVSTRNSDVQGLKRKSSVASFDGEGKTPSNSSQVAEPSNAESDLSITSDLTTGALGTSQQLIPSLIDSSDEGAKDVRVNGLVDTNVVVEPSLPNPSVIDSYSDGGSNQDTIIKPMIVTNIVASPTFRSESLTDSEDSVLTVVEGGSRKDLEAVINTSVSTPKPVVDLNISNSEGLWETILNLDEPPASTSTLILAQLGGWLRRYLFWKKSKPTADLNIFNSGVLGTPSNPNPVVAEPSNAKFNLSSEYIFEISLNSNEDVAQSRGCFGWLWRLFSKKSKHVTVSPALVPTLPPLMIDSSNDSMRIEFNADEVATPKNRFIVTKNNNDNFDLRFWNSNGSLVKTSIEFVPEDAGFLNQILNNPEIRKIIIKCNKEGEILSGIFIYQNNTEKNIDNDKVKKQFQDIITRVKCVVDKTNLEIKSQFHARKVNNGSHSASFPSSHSSSNALGISTTM